MKRFCVCIISFFCVFSLFAEEQNTVRIAALAGSSGIGMAYLFSNPPVFDSHTTSSFEIAGSVNVFLPKLLHGEVDIGILPPNVAAKLYNLDSNSVVAGAIVGNDMLTLITRDTSIKSITDLKGKHISVAGQGATPEYVTKTLLKHAGLSDSDLNLNFSIPTQEIPAALISNKIAYAIVPEPFATVATLKTASDEHPVYRALYFKNLWNSIDTENDFPMTLCVIRKEFAEKKPDIVRAFLSAYQDSIKQTISNPNTAGQIVEKMGFGIKSAIAEKAIPSCNFVYIPATEGRPAIERLLSVFLEYAPNAIGGKLPDDGFYFK